MNTTTSIAKQFTLHFGSSAYTVDGLNGTLHEKNAVFTLSGEKTIKKASNMLASHMDNRRDIKFFAKRDNAAKLATYEFAIRRGYLYENCSPDNLLSYSLGLGSGEHRFNLNDGAQNYLKSLG